MIREWSPDLIILDEAQRIKNWNTRTAKSVKQLESTFAIGGGSAPGQECSSFSLELDPLGNPEHLLVKLREWDPPIIATITAGYVLLNIATIDTSEHRDVGAALRHILNSG